MKIFKEIQRFNQWWLIVLFAFVYLKYGYDLLGAYREKTEINMDTLIMLIVSSIILVLVTLLIFSLRLETRIDEKGMSYQFWPFHLKAKNIPWESLEECSVRKYSPILEYGGWGFRGVIKSRLFGLHKNGKAYNVKGNIGIQMVLKDGSRILIGTQKMEQAKQVLNTYSYKLIDATIT